MSPPVSLMLFLGMPGSVMRFVPACSAIAAASATEAI